MDFQSSTHRLRWIFTPENLDAKRKELNEACIRASREAYEQEGPGAAGGEPLTVDEEAQLRRGTCPTPL